MANSLVYQMHVILLCGFIFALVAWPVLYIFSKPLSQMPDVFWSSFIAGVMFEAIFIIFMVKGNLDTFSFTCTYPLWAPALQGSIGYMSKLVLLIMLIRFVLKPRTEVEGALIGGAVGLGLGYEKLFLYTVMGVDKFLSTHSITLNWTCCEFLPYIESMVLAGYWFKKFQMHPEKGGLIGLFLSSMVLYVSTKFCIFKISYAFKVAMALLYALIFIYICKIIAQKTSFFGIDLMKEAISRKSFAWSLKTLIALEAMFMVPLFLSLIF